MVSQFENIINRHPQNMAEEVFKGVPESLANSINKKFEGQSHNIEYNLNREEVLEALRRAIDAIVRDYELFSLMSGFIEYSISSEMELNGTYFLNELEKSGIQNLKLNAEHISQLGEIVSKVHKDKILNTLDDERISEIHNKIEKIITEAYQEVNKTIDTEKSEYILPHSGLDAEGIKFSNERLKSVKEKIQGQSHNIEQSRNGVDKDIDIIPKGIVKKMKEQLESGIKNESVEQSKNGVDKDTDIIPKGIVKKMKEQLESGINKEPIAQSKSKEKSEGQSHNIEQSRNGVDKDIDIIPKGIVKKMKEQLESGINKEPIAQSKSKEKSEGQSHNIEQSRNGVDKDIDIIPKGIVRDNDKRLALEEVIKQHNDNRGHHGPKAMVSQGQKTRGVEITGTFQDPKVGDDIIPKDSRYEDKAREVVPGLFLEKSSEGKYNIYIDPEKLGEQILYVGSNGEYIKSEKGQLIGDGTMEMLVKSLGNSLNIKDIEAEVGVVKTADKTLSEFTQQDFDQLHHSVGKAQETSLSNDLSLKQGLGGFSPPSQGFKVQQGPIMVR